MMSQALSHVANRPMWTRKADWRGETKPPFGTPINRNHWAAKHLDACWLLNEGAGNIAYDSAGANHGTLSGFSDPPTATSGWCGGDLGPALRFDAINDFINCGAKLDLTKGLSIVAVCKSTTATYGIILARRAAAENWSMVVRFNPGGVLGFLLSQSGDDSTSSSVTTDIAYNDGLKHVVIMTFEPSASMRIYVDGTLSKEKTIGIVNSIAAKPLLNYTIGKRDQPGSEQYFVGDISLIGLYSYALPSSDVAHLSDYLFCMFGDSDD